MLAASGEAGDRAGRPDLGYSGWANAACIASADGRHERALELAQRGALSALGIPTIEFHMAGLVAYALARLGRHDEAREATRPPVRAGRAARLPAARAGRRPRRRAAGAARRRARACRGPARPRAGRRPPGPAVRGAAAAGRGARAARSRRRGRRRDPGRRARAHPRGAPPGGARRPDGVRPGAEPRGRAATARSRSGGCARPSTTGGGSRERTTSRASTSPRWSTSAARRSPASSTRRGSSSASPWRCGDWRRMPTFDDSATTTAPVEEVWKLLYDPARMVEWWDGVERVDGDGHDGQGNLTIYPAGYPGLPDAAGAAHRRRRPRPHHLVPHQATWSTSGGSNRSTPARASACTSRSPRTRPTGWRASAAGVSASLRSLAALSTATAGPRAPG